MPVTVEHSGAIACLGCRYPLPIADVTGPEGARCPRCQSRQEGRAFKAAFTPPALLGARPAAALEGEACCFEHATRRAETACDSCGRFLCALCQFTFGARHLCPSCIRAERARNSDRWIARRTNLDSVALAIATIPMLGIWTTIVGGPMAIYFGIRALRQPPGPLPRARWRAILGIILGSLQVIAWLILLITFFAAILYQGKRVG